MLLVSGALFAAEPETLVFLVQGMGRSSSEIREQENHRVLQRRLERAFKDANHGAVAVRRVAWEAASLQVDCEARRKSLEHLSFGEERSFYDKATDIFCYKLERAKESKRGFVMLRRKEIKMLAGGGEYVAGLYAYLSDTRRREMREVLAERLARVPPQSRVVLITHSLGSLMAYDCLMHHPELQVDAWISFALPAFDLHYMGWDLPLVDVSGAAQWVNVYDGKDVVSSPMRFELPQVSGWSAARMRGGRVFQDGDSEGMSVETFAAKINPSQASLRLNLEVDMKGELYRVHGRYWKDRKLARFIARFIQRPS
jgi:hypothetical protein